MNDQPKYVFLVESALPGDRDSLIGGIFTTMQLAKDAYPYVAWDREATLTGTLCGTTDSLWWIITPIKLDKVLPA